ncbi:MAG: tetratricopeptide repeat protein, partial [Pseudomonadota bacterium]
MGKIASISLCMIVKDEEEYLPVCLQKTRPILDEIVIVDTGSRDRTVEVARNFGAKIFSHDWADDFSEARNISLTHATKDWILILDADELISERDLAELPTLCREEIFKAFSFTTRNYTNDSSGAIWIPDDGSYAESAKFAGWFPSEKVRLFRRDERVRFEGVVHELVEASIRELGWAIGYTHIPIHHYGKIKKDNILKTKKRLYVQWGREKVRREHSNPKAYYEHGIQCSDLGLHEEAAGAFSRVLELDNNFPLVEGLLGASLVNLGRFNEAIEVLKKGIQKEPENPGIYNNIGSAYYQLGEYREACRYLEEATQLNPQYAAAFKNLGMAYYGKGEKAKAMDAFQKALELNPRMDDIREVLQRLNSMVQGSEFAVQTSEGEREQGRMNSEGIAAKNGPLRIVILEVEDGMLGDCCARGFKDIGHITKRIRFKVEDETHSQLAFDVFRMVKEVMDFTPDFVLSIN